MMIVFDQLSNLICSFLFIQILLHHSFPQKSYSPHFILFSGLQAVESIFFFLSRSLLRLPGLRSSKLNILIYGTLLNMILLILQMRKLKLVKFKSLAQSYIAYVALKWGNLGIELGLYLTSIQYCLPQNEGFKSLIYHTLYSAL